MQGWNKKYDEWVEEIGCVSDPPEKMTVPNKSKSKPKGTPAQSGKAHTDLGKPQVHLFRFMVIRGNSLAVLFHAVQELTASFHPQAPLRHCLVVITL